MEFAIIKIKQHFDLEEFLDIPIFTKRQKNNFGWNIRKSVTCISIFFIIYTSSMENNFLLPHQK